MQGNEPKRQVPVGGNPILQYFSWTHLHEELASVSRRFQQLAMQIEVELPNGPEKSVALRKLLEAKDAAVRAAL